MKCRKCDNEAGDSGLCLVCNRDHSANKDLALAAVGVVGVILAFWLIGAGVLNLILQ